MSAFVCILDRSGRPIAPAELRRLAEPLEHHGGEVSSLCRGPVGIAVGHRGGSDALSRHGPLTDPETGRAVAVAGRFTEVGEPAQPEPGGDASGYAARALHRLGGSGPRSDPERERHFVAGLSGSFALVVADPAAGSISITRDHLGTLKVYYAVDDRRLVAASDASILLRDPRITDEIDQVSVARFLGFHFGWSERSFFGAIKELPPAHQLRGTAATVRTEQYWRFRRRPRSAGRDPEEITGAFLDLLGRAVEAETAGIEPERIALSLSGGLDSTALAALAPRGIRAFSWSFDDTPDADERTSIDAVSRHLDLPVHWVQGDGLHPLCGDFAARFVHAGSPYVNAFAALKHRLYEAARAAGCERILVGDGGDALYAAREYWLRDALAAGGRGALRSLGDTVRRAARGDRFARLALVRVLPVHGLRTALRRDPTPWLTPTARATLPERIDSPILPPGGPRTRHEQAVGAKHSEIEGEEQWLFDRCGVERSNPFWSWPLLEMAIQLPATWYHRDGRSKILTRKAFRGRLPERVLEQGRIGQTGRTGLLGTFFLQGIEAQRESVREWVFRRPLSDWQRHVRRDWVEPYLSATRSIAFGHTILWRVISYELWIRRRLGRL